jgi:2-oxoglutarate ferredoxin oxidoreductase subunit gamma
MYRVLMLVALSQEAFDKFLPSVKSDALLLVDEDLVDTGHQERVHRIPCTRLAEELGRRIVANVVMLGFFTSVTGVVSQESVVEAIEDSVKSKTVPLNLRAFETGFRYAVDTEQVQ